MQSLKYIGCMYMILLEILYVLTYNNKKQIERCGIVPLDEKTLIAIFVVCILAVSAYTGFAIKLLMTAWLHRLQFKSLCKSLENIIFSFTKSKNFECTMTEQEKVILEIVKPNKGFPKACRTISGLLQQYIYWLNTERFVPTSKKISFVELKEGTYELIKLYKSSAFASDADMYDESLLNAISKSIDKRDFDAAKNEMAELDAQITKNKKKHAVLQFWLPHLVALISAVAAAIISKMID